MSGKTGIEWTDATWNPIRGCSPVSSGCKNCYASKVAKRFSGPGKPYEGLVRINAAGERTDEWNGQVRFVEKHLLDPLRWKGRPLYEPGNPKSVGYMPGMRIFVNSMSDLFHENVSDEVIDKVFAVMALCPQHTFQVLTKRPERMLTYLSHPEVRFDIASIGVRNQHLVGVAYDARSDDTWPLPNVWLGVSVENQATADERIPLLLQTPAAVRFISAEPLLGNIDIYQYLGGERNPIGPAYCGKGLDWVIAGGESGPGARPMHPDWAHSLRIQCLAAGVSFFFKQWGEWSPGSEFWEKNTCAVDEAGRVVIDALRENYPPGASSADGWEMMHRAGKHAAGAMLDGCEWREFPGGSGNSGSMKGRQ